MIDETLSLVELEIKRKAQLAAMFEDLKAAGEEHFLSDWERAQGDIAAYVKRLEDFSQGVGLAEGVVPESTYWLVRDGTTFLGFSRLRHRLVPALEHHGGHVGHTIRPSERRKGYGPRILALALDKAREIGLARVLVTCDTDNIPSVRVIEANGGVLENQLISNRSGKMISRYWIAL
jgi:predicted acetyltransferase